MPNKIFGIGLSKTGTNSLTVGLQKLGIDAVHWDFTKDTFSYSKERGLLVDLKLYDQHAAFTDAPVAYWYKELDKAYPNSKFILTTRDIDAWLKSCKKHFHELIPADKLKDKIIQPSETDMLAKALYGDYLFREESFIEGFERHHQAVHHYFESRSEDLLVIDVKEPDSWGDLTEFLGFGREEGVFPHEYKSSDREKNQKKKRLRSFLKP